MTRSAQLSVGLGSSDLFAELRMDSSAAVESSSGLYLFAVCQADWPHHTTSSFDFAGLPLALPLSTEL